jgi:molybdopterin-guanine dinucleotide biosynthesis protein A
VTGVLLVGGASRRFGSPKALARAGGRTLAEAAYATLEAAFGDVVAVGKRADGLELPFEVHDDGSELRAPIVGVAAGLRLARSELCVVVPTDMPAVTAAHLLALASAAEGALAAVPQSGPLPGAYRRDALPVLERRIAAGELALHAAAAEVGAVVVELPAEALENVNTAADLERLLGRPPA